MTDIIKPKQSFWWLIIIVGYTLAVIGLVLSLCAGLGDGQETGPIQTHPVPAPTRPAGE